MTWEYKVVYISSEKWTSTGLPDDINVEFNNWGAEGWELVKIEPRLTGGFFIFGFGVATSTAGYVAFFKKSKP